MTQPPYRSNQPFDPTKPLGPQPLDATRIDQFTPPRSPMPWLFALGAVLVAVLIAVTATLSSRPQPPSPTPTPSAASTTARPSGQPFVSPDGRVEGNWEVLETRWNDEGVEIKLRIAVDQGTLWYSFMAFTNDAAEVLDPGPPTSSPALGQDPIDAGDERIGWIYFPSYRANLTLLLANPAGRQISALLVPA